VNKQYANTTKTKAIILSPVIKLTFELKFERSNKIKYQMSNTLISFLSEYKPSKIYGGKKMKILLLIIGFFSIAFSQQDKNDIIGFWKPENLNEIIEIYEEDETAFGKVALILVDGDTIVPKNPVQILSDFKFNGKDAWENGSIYIAERKKKIDGKLNINDDGNLVVTGYVFVFPKSFIWYKLNTSKIKYK
jgi:uncharacterized protein (DUF2147 family)